MKKNYIIPQPILDEKEMESIDNLTKKYEKLCELGMLSKVGKKVGEIIPEKVKNVAKKASKNITEKELYMQMMKIVGEGFKVVEKNKSLYYNAKQSINTLMVKI